MSATYPIIYGISFYSILEAYEDCIKKKRSTNSYTAFTFNYEKHLVNLWNRIRTATYEPTHSSCFIVNKPVHREIFAAAFIDRVVHHWIALRIEPILEYRFKAQNNVSKNCRKGEGVKSAVNMMVDMLYNASNGYTTDCYIFKGDFSNFFMSIDKALLWEMINLYLGEHYHYEDKDCLLYLLRVTIFHCPQDRCIKHSPDFMWQYLPKRKSLFYTPRTKGEAIGNLPSQLLANFFASVFDDWMMRVKGVKYYIRFVDDFSFILPNKEDVVNLIPEIKNYLQEQLLTELHPNKIYVQHYSKGVRFVGTVIKPGRVYISNRSLGYFYSRIHEYNKLAMQGLQAEYVEKFVQSINSYLGLLKHYRTYKLRRKIAEKHILPLWGKYIYFTDNFLVAKVKVCYKRRTIALETLRKKEGKRSFAPELD